MMRLGAPRRVGGIVSGLDDLPTTAIKLVRISPVDGSPLLFTAGQYMPRFDGVPARSGYSMPIVTATTASNFTFRARFRAASPRNTSMGTEGR